ncbi:PaaI family thioesterase [candidate division KSB1 bacterium]|nr:PaaI family thioesterase [candidate division KSB1 bacterium]
MQLPNSKSCFVCGTHNPNGLQLTFHAEEDRVWAEFEPKSWMVGYENVIHGGLISTVLDEIVIWTAYHAMGRFAVTAELNVRFRQPLRLGDRVTVEGHFQEDRGRMWMVSAEMIRSDGRKLAEGTAKLIPMTLEASSQFEAALKR